MKTIEAILAETAVMDLNEEETVLIAYIDHNARVVHAIGIGEYTGENYSINFDDIDVATVNFYKLTKIETEDNE